MLKISNVKVALDEKDYMKVVANQLQISKKYIQDLTLFKRSIDARKKDHVYYNCIFTFHSSIENKLLKKPNVTAYTPYVYETLKHIEDTVVVVGSGPCGLFAAYNLARSGNKVIVIERGEDVDTRTKDIDQFFAGGKLNNKSNVQFGEGGAGTFSDGKLTTGNKDQRIRFVLETFVKFGAPDDILYNAKPHIGTDYLKVVIKNMREYIVAQGGEYHFSSQLTDIIIENNQLKAIEINHKDIINTKKLVLAIGHSARDTYEMLYNRDIDMEAKAFAVGFRVEHLQSLINQNQYGKFAEKLPAAPYKLVTHTSEHRGVYSFCMCPGGEVINSSSEEGRLVVNGMSYHARDGKNANSAILVQVTPDDYGHSPLDGIRFQREIERKAYERGGSNYFVPVCRIEDFLDNTSTHTIEKVIPTVKPGYTYTNLTGILPEVLERNMREGLKLMDRKIPGFTKDAVLSAVESRSSSPLRMVRNDQGECNIKGIYPAGEGAGYAGGIVSSAVDGLRVSENIVNNTRK